MDVSQVGSYVDKIKEFTLKNKVAVAAVTAAVLVLGVGYQVYQSQPKSLVAAVQVEFTGYDGFGELSYDSKEIQRIAYRSAGFNKNQTEDLVNQDAVVLSEVYADASLGQKYQKAAAMISSFSLSKDCSPIILIRNPVSVLSSFVLKRHTDIKNSLYIT